MRIFWGGLKRKNHKWAVGSKLSETKGWDELDIQPQQSPYVMKKRSHIKVLFINSVNGSMGRLSKALMMYEGIEADCIVPSFYPRRNFVYPGEANIYQIFTHEDWRQYLKWAVRHYDIIQTSTFPIWPAVAECYDWLTKVLGQRHVWRETGFVHHYLHREEILPLKDYFSDIRSRRPPQPERFCCNTFQHNTTHFLTGTNMVFYSSPEKGAYLNGKHTYWLPTIRDPECFKVKDKLDNKDNLLIYVPHHDNAAWKGFTIINQMLRECRDEGLPIEIVTATTAHQYFPEIVYFDFSKTKSEDRKPYPLPYYMIPELLNHVDIVVDQIVMGCYGNTAVEAMLTGIPVVGQKRYEEIKDAPIWEVTIDNFKVRMRELINNPEHRVQLGSQGRNWAIAHHSPQAVAKIAAEKYRMILE
ncbi:glycosyltransferase [Legionella oakridgensis]|uniref:Glycosyltransferase n=2 Tax=Legionella oakridgensis TaxID=29423 RepID=W0BAB3_9GAMM|nr:glycosyltransferase family 1 protein [Legionella oakridgensis]AHE65641.1 hypothetical protein Loa_00050 [Legionella oakridgensis ATCC 33761 = DSM 21215]KTD38272.1 hypothetical protein Loak_1948 [Legionella oakridgensis]STY15596.1 Uncharacterised protein [Legionella longbeachae]